MLLKIFIVKNFYKKTLIKNRNLHRNFFKIIDKQFHCKNKLKKKTNFIVKKYLIFGYTQNAGYF